MRVERVQRLCFQVAGPCAAQQKRLPVCDVWCVAAARADARVHARFSASGHKRKKEKRHRTEERAEAKRDESPQRQMCMKRTQQQTRLVFLLTGGAFGVHGAKITLHRAPKLHFILDRPRPGANVKN